MENQKPQETAIQSLSSQSSVSTTNFILRQRPAGSSEKFGEIWRLEVDRSREDGRVIETRETFADNEATRLFRKNTGLDRSQTNRKNVQPTITFGLTDNLTPTTNSIEYEEEGSTASMGEIGEENLGRAEPTEVAFEMSIDRPRDFQNQRTRREEVSQTPTNTSNYPITFKTNLILSILGGLSFTAFWFVNRINKNF